MRLLQLLNNINLYYYIFRQLVVQKIERIIEIFLPKSADCRRLLLLYTCVCTTLYLQTSIHSTIIIIC